MRRNISTNLGMAASTFWYSVLLEWVGVTYVLMLKYCELLISADLTSKMWYCSDPSSGQYLWHICSPLSWSRVSMTMTTQP